PTTPNLAITASSSATTGLPSAGSSSRQTHYSASWILSIEVAYRPVLPFSPSADPDLSLIGNFAVLKGEFLGSAVAVSCNGPDQVTLAIQFVPMAYFVDIAGSPFGPGGTQVDMLNRQLVVSGYSGSEVSLPGFAFLRDEGRAVAGSWHTQILAFHSFSPSILGDGVRYGGCGRAIAPGAVNHDRSGRILVSPGIGGLKRSVFRLLNHFGLGSKALLIGSYCPACIVSVITTYFFHPALLIKQYFLITGNVSVAAVIGDSLDYRLIVVMQVHV